MAELGRRYGFFRCTGCNGQWESSHVYVNNMTGQVAYKQKCKKCNIECDPYHVEELKCSICGMQGKLCKCTKEEKMSRHVNEKRPHRSDLCMKCRAGIRCTSPNLML
ncbi:zygote arrest protein 1 [Lingula anatina]|uniref:Zygote arrest protein 1 n=1 Tax=Lingula anatina TaxID=7574 RepID=A0A1S3IEJ2_LINAN|nr:zygote arrest protein 1 [Lingula anatina]|eukprot:XP_013396680.1 zygote arrest protein 1 [Lingula anatina]